ncbi:MAG TPA: TPM domain-containing protein [Bacteroidales bacterium]|nr:TPM domain-containing protein [Bacteroidales bacterium]
MKNRSTLSIFSLLILASLLSSSVSGQQLPKPMVPLRLVNDFTGLLQEQQMMELNNKLFAFNNETSTQIYVVTFDDLQGFDIGDFGVRLAEEWGIGQQGRDNGILILVSPANRKVTIQTGYGLEGAVPDAIAMRLINNVITPGFRTGNYYGSLDSATNVLMSLTRGEFTADDYMKGNKESIPAAAVFMIMVSLLVLISMFRTRRRFYSPTRSLPWWMLMGAGSVPKSGWGSFSSGRGSFGSGGGGFGGFGGGGGGSFGGGGASGGW